MQTPKWSEAAAQLMQTAKSALGWSAQPNEAFDKTFEALPFLGEKKLYHYTFIKCFCIGYNPAPVQFPFSEWGIDPAQLSEQQRKKGGLNVPDGILIPWYVDGQICKLTVIRPDKTPSYGQILGSVDCLFNGDSIEPDKPVLLVESELEAMRLSQEVGDRITCVATGKRQTADIIEQLDRASFVLQCFTDDEQAEHWTSALACCIRWFPPCEPLQGWLEAGLYSAMIEFGQLYPLHAPTLARVPRILSKEETIERFQSEVARLFGGCTVIEVPRDWTPAKHHAEMRQRAYWK